MDNIIIQLIERKMKQDGWNVYTPDSYYLYLSELINEEIINSLRDQLEDETT